MDCTKFDVFVIKKDGGLEKNLHENLEQNLYLIKSVKISVLLLLKGENIYLKSWKSIRSRHKMNQITTQVSIFETQKPRNLCRVILIFHKTILNFRTRSFQLKCGKYISREKSNRKKWHSRESWLLLDEMTLWNWLRCGKYQRQIWHTKKKNVIY